MSVGCLRDRPARRPDSAHGCSTPSPADWPRPLAARPGDATSLSAAAELLHTARTSSRWNRDLRVASSVLDTQPPDPFLSTRSRASRVTVTLELEAEPAKAQTLDRRTSSGDDDRSRGRDRRAPAHRPASPIAFPRTRPRELAQRQDCAPDALDGSPSLPLPRRGRSRRGRYELNARRPAGHAAARNDQRSASASIVMRAGTPRRIAVPTAKARRS